MRGESDRRRIIIIIIVAVEKLCDSSGMGGLRLLK